MIHAFELAGACYLGETAICWLWGLCIRFRWDGISLHVLRYHVLASLIAIDEYDNVLTAGNFAETISSRLGIGSNHGFWWGKTGKNFLDELQRDHCENAIVNDLKRDKDEENYLKGETG